MRLFGGAFFVEKSCCFILPDGFRSPLSEGDAFDVLLSALLYHLTFSEGVTKYLFIYDEEAAFSAGRILGGIRAYAPDICRTLVYPEKGELDFTFRFLADNRFEERQTVSLALFEDREMLYRSLIEASDVAVFFIEGNDCPIERRAYSFAVGCGNRTIDLGQAKDLPAWFRHV